MFRQLRNNLAKSVLRRKGNCGNNLLLMKLFKKYWKLLLQMTLAVTSRDYVVSVSQIKWAQWSLWDADPASLSQGAGEDECGWGQSWGTRLTMTKLLLLMMQLFYFFKLSPISIPLPWSLEKIYIAGVRPQLQIVYHTLWLSKDLKY